MKSRSSMARAFIVLIAGMMMAAVMAVGASAVVSGDNGLIAFDSDRDGNREIYVMNADGTGQNRLTDNSGTDADPAWSPDGTRLAFWSSRDGNREIYVMNANGTGQANLTGNSAADGAAAWSPDGTRIAFSSNRDGGDYEIWVMDADGSDVTRLTNSPGEDNAPAWSPDGTQIAFYTSRDGNREIYAMDADGSDVTRLTNNPAEDLSAAWSPDGTLIAFTSTRDGQQEIYVMDADGSDVNRLTNNSFGDAVPAWSPDGTKIVLERNDGGVLSGEVLVMNADGTGQTYLSSNAANDYNPDWQTVFLNQPPVVAADAASIEVAEGQLAVNAGTVSDPDQEAATLSASVGTVTINTDGTWSWWFGTSDGPADSQTVTITADDGNGGTAQTTFDLAVTNVAPTVESISVPFDPVAIDNGPVNVTAGFSDPGGPFDEHYSCSVDYGDDQGDQSGVVDGTTCIGPNHTYAEPGVYAVSVTVTDKDGDSDSAVASDYIVIYDPTGGFVTGGGWIDSPEGAYQPDPSLVGKATFGFVSKYKKGATVPTGNTQFQFQTGDLNFHSSSYDWLVVTGSNFAKFKGVGTINGEGEYKFQIWAGDGDPDTFRIKIWTEINDVETVTYDNGMNQEIGGGNIVVHTKK